MRRLPALFFGFFCLATYGQDLHLYSISIERQPAGQNDYTLNGPNMQIPRSRLLDPGYYGPAGVYKKTIRIHDTFSLSNSLTGIRAIDPGAIFFFGGFNALDGSLQRFTTAELDSFYKWTREGGRVIFTGGIYMPGMVDYTYMNHRYGFQTDLGSSLLLIGDPDAPEGTPFNGPFGPVTPIRQGGGGQGFYTVLPESAKVLATDASGRETLIMDCATMDILVPDVDVFTALSADHSYAGFSNQDRFIGNTIALLNSLPDPPKLKIDGLDLSVQDNFSAYQWYHNGEAVDGATDNTFKATKKGRYHVEVPVPGGCKVKSEPFIDGGLTCEPFVPSAFSPDGNGVNEKLCIYGQCLQDFTFRIFDRWGELVFTSNAVTDCWDGTFRGRKLGTGTYAWALTAAGMNGNIVKRSGNIMLVR